jgi:hypothetical protein
MRAPEWALGYDPNVMSEDGRAYRFGPFELDAANAERRHVAFLLWKPAMFAAPAPGSAAGRR